MAESAVVGKPTPTAARSSRRSSCCGRASTADELIQELQDHCKRVTAPYKYPREIEFVDELPKTRSGKIRRVELRRREEERASHETVPGS